MIRIFRHYLPRWSLLLIAMEGMFYTLAVYAGVAVRFWNTPPQPDDVHAEVLLPRALLFALVMVISMAATGRYHRLMEDGLPGEVLNVAISFILGLMAMSLLFYLLPTLFIGRGAFGYAIFFALLAAITTRWFAYRFLLDQELLQRHVLVLGTGPNALLIPPGGSPGQEGFRVVGYWPLPGEEGVVEPGAILREERSLASFARSVPVQAIVITTSPPDHCEALLDDLMECKVNGIQVIDLPTFFEQEYRFIHLGSLDPRWWALHSEGVERSLVRQGVKKLFDVTLSLTILALAWPLMVLAALAIWLEAGGRHPILYHQQRVGFGGKTFQLIKFRSMRPDAEKDGPRWAVPNDARITLVGRFMRKTRLDELPQLFNVIKGEMSLVGPRPERPEFVTTLSQRIPYYQERLLVKPGITGWAQICYGYGASAEDAAEKLKYDLYYVKNNSLFMDCLVLIQSLEVVLFGRGIKAPR